MWHGRARSPCRCGEPGPVADLASPAPMRMWKRRAQLRRRCDSGEMISNPADHRATGRGPVAALAEIESTFGVLAHALFAKPSLAVNRELPAPVTRVDAVVEVITTARVEPLACERSRVHRRERAHRHAPSHPYMLVCSDSTIIPSIQDKHACAASYASHSKSRCAHSQLEPDCMSTDPLTMAPISRRTRHIRSRSG